jgi:hypothetical protein
MAVSTSFHFELAANIAPEESTAVSFVGVFDSGTKIIFANRKGDKAYCYTLISKIGEITSVDFSGLLETSLGKFWGEIKRTHDLVATLDDFTSCVVTSDKWHNEVPGAVIPQQEWVIKPGIYNF